MLILNLMVLLWEGDEVMDAAEEGRIERLEVGMGCRTSLKVN